MVATVFKGDSYVSYDIFLNAIIPSFSCFVYLVFLICNIFFLLCLRQSKREHSMSHISTKFLLCFFSIILASSTSSANNPISNLAYQALEFGNHTKQTRISKLISITDKGLVNFKNKITLVWSKFSGILDHPTRRWRWSWLIFGLLGVILLLTAILAGIGTGGGIVFRTLYYLGLGSSLLSSASFMIWIIKLIQG